MALTQSVRLAGPSWDDEVVPALRKRLESESRTLAKRMSAISLSSVEEPASANYSAYVDKSARQRLNSPPSSPLQQQFSNSGAQRTPLAYQQQVASDRTMTTTASRVNGNANPTATSTFQRSRTYSTPYASDLPNGHANGNARPKNNTTKSADPTRSLSPRPVDIKPTRIPKASRPPISVPSSSASSPYTNNHGHGTTVTSSTLSPELSYQPLPGGTQRVVVPSSSSQSLEISNRGTRQTPGLLNESPPFQTDTTLSSGFSQPSINRNTSLELEEDPPRASMESEEERPYEHWYRGEVSRNGGVGELRVGRRQEMLDIANYGHMVKKLAPNRTPLEEPTGRSRKRADSIAGITTKERERSSLYLEEEHIGETGQVLDETPLTDLDGEESEAYSTVDQYSGVAYAYLPGAEDVSNPSSQRWTTVAGAHEMTRSTTPTQTSTSMLPRPSSRQQQPSTIPPTRIPGPSSRRSSESRSTMMTSSPALGTANNTQYSSSSKTPPPPAPSSSLNARQQVYANSTVPNAAGKKRGVSPAQKNTKVAAAKMTKSKTLPAKREADTNRGSVAYYPTPGGEGEDMADAIPSWIQPVPREGNWDDVVLPVVARNKGLDGYENADGSPKPKKVRNNIEPAPGTFGFDHSKYRPPRTEGVSIPMDEFGRQANNHLAVEDVDEERQEGRLNGKSSVHDETQLPVRQGQSPSPAPFAHYAPTSVEVRHPGLDKREQQEKLQRHPDDDEGSSGCCKCVIM